MRRALSLVVSNRNSNDSAALPIQSLVFSCVLSSSLVLLRGQQQQVRFHGSHNSSTVVSSSEDASTISTTTPHSSAPSSSSSLSPASTTAAETVVVPVALQPTPPKVGRHRGARQAVSGIQQECLTLYRQLLRATKRFDDAETRSNLTRHIQREMRLGAKTVPRTHFSKIEWLLHQGRNRLEDIRAMKKNAKFRLVGGS